MGHLYSQLWFPVEKYVLPCTSNDNSLVLPIMIIPIILRRSVSIVKSSAEQWSDFSRIARDGGTTLIRDFRNNIVVRNLMRSRYINLAFSCSQLLLSIHSIYVNDSLSLMHMQGPGMRAMAEKVFIILSIFINSSSVKLHTQDYVLRQRLRET